LSSGADLDGDLDQPALSSTAVEVSATVVEGFHKFPRRGRGALDEFIGIDGA